MSAAYIFETYMEDSVMIVLPYINIMIGSTETFIAKYILGYPLKSCIQSGINVGCYIIKQHRMTRGDTNLCSHHNKTVEKTDHGALIYRHRGTIPMTISNYQKTKRLFKMQRTCAVIITNVMAVLPYINIMIGSTKVSGIKCGSQSICPCVLVGLADIESVARKMSIFKVKKTLMFNIHSFLEDLVSTFNVPEISEKDIIDTNEAGDAFVGGMNQI
ncbi:hypothetical protein AGLY_001529 [Aphis glycines]|uniref:Uncharacterized protein n=1 Tax=Aphis glycines TaxID=307491 RepID=A0A6G0U6E7_APHGL|nr:hypothetical protein AGLY_001529 [Aphis glycines]